MYLEYVAQLRHPFCADVFLYTMEGDKLTLENFNGWNQNHFGDEFPVSDPIELTRWEVTWLHSNQSNMSTMLTVFSDGRVTG